jgi:hypothetical protein
MRRSDRRIRLQDESLVAGNRAKIEIAVAASLCRGRTGGERHGYNIFIL